jgi:glycosyltransferase involved in cell wall biosynthesis
MQAVDSTDVVLVVNGNDFEDHMVDGVDVRGVTFASLLDDVPFRIKVWRSTLNNLTATYKLQRALSDRPDVIYERHSLGSLLGIGLSLFLRCPLVFEVNGVPDEEAAVDLGISSRVLRSLLFGVTKLQLRRARSIVVQSEELRRVLVERYSVKDVVVVPNGVDPPKAANIPPRHGGPAQICIVGTLDEIHNLEPALSAIRRSQEAFDVVIIGDGRRRPIYEEALRDDTRFKFRGRLEHEEAMDILNASDLGLAIYDEDYPLFRKYGFYLCPLKVLEYLGHGVPCIFVGPVNVWTTELERRGAVLAIPNTEALRPVLDQLLHSPNALTQMGQRARRVAADYTWQGSANATVATLRRISGSPTS